MSLKGLGTRSERGGGFPIISLFSTAFILAGVFLFGQELVAYSDQDAASLEADVIIAGVQVGGLNEAQAQARWEEIYLEQPITLVYRDSPMVFSPRALGFLTNNQSMLAAARARSTGEQNFWTGFWAHLWAQRSTTIEVALDASLQEGQLRGVLEDIARRYDSEAQDIGFDLTTLTFQSGAQGSRLDIDASIPLIETALFNPDPGARRVVLPTQGVTGSGADMGDLRSAIISYMESQGVLYDAETTIVSVFVMDLNTGEEMSILGDVAHSGVSTIKVPIIVNYFRHQVAAPDPDTSYLMASAIICSHNPGANYLMQVTSATRDNMIEGLQLSSQTMLDMGAINSWITSPLFVGPDGEYPIIQAPLRDNLPNPEYNAQPDPFNQTTAEDMGTVLAHIYDCAQHGGGLRAVFPDEVTQTECQQMLEVLSGVRFYRFSELGTPEEVEIAHKVGYGDETVGDVAIVFSPGTDYVFVMYVWEEDLDNDNLTELNKWNLIDEVARITYNYFNPAEALEQPRAPVNPLGGAACVLPRTSEEINLSNIDANRFDENGDPVESACYDWPLCRPFDNWGQGATP